MCAFFVYLIREKNVAEFVRRMPPMINVAPSNAAASMMRTSLTL